jgi:hypothetical protein
MELVDAPTMAPASCCLTSMGGPLIDTRREVAQFGRAYLHPDIVREAAAVLGLIDAGEAERAKAALAAAEEQLEAMDRELDELEGKYNALKASMAETMQHGFVVDRRGQIRYRETKAGNRIAKDET